MSAVVDWAAMPWAVTEAESIKTQHTSHTITQQTHLDNTNTHRKWGRISALQRAIITVRQITELQQHVLTTVNNTFNKWNRNNTAATLVVFFSTASSNRQTPQTNESTRVIIIQQQMRLCHTWFPDWRMNPCGGAGSIESQNQRDNTQVLFEWSDSPEHHHLTRGS